MPVLRKEAGQGANQSISSHTEAMSNTDEKSTEQPIWRDIDTAPKGRIYAAEYYPERKWWWMGEARWDEEAEGYLAIRGGLFREPSHWFPLPDDPDTQMRQMRDESAVIPADHDDLTTSKVISEQRPTPETANLEATLEADRDYCEEQGLNYECRHRELRVAKMETLERQRDEARAQRDEAVQEIKALLHLCEHDLGMDEASPYISSANSFLSRIGKEGGE